MNTLSKIGQQIVDSLLEVLNAAIAWLPNFLGAIIILIIGALVARLIQRAIKELFKLIKLESASDKLGVQDKIKTIGIESNITNILSGLIYWIILLVFVSSAASILQIPAVTTFVNKLIGWLPAIFAGLVIMVLGVMVAEAITNILDKVKFGKTYKTVVRWFILVVAFITAVEQIGINITFLTENLQILVGGLALAFGIAFGMGGREKAKDFLEAHWK
jgi:hypothetical protein